MKNGILLVRHEDNRLICQILYNRVRYNLKIRLFPANLNLANLNNSSVEFEIERGKIIKVIHFGTLIYEIPIARAPYNFIPLNNNKKLISADYLDINKYYTEKDGYFSGYFTLEATNPTPIFVRGTLTSDLNNESSFINQKGDTVRIQNYCPAGNWGIPGSSVRGMIRTLIEISSFGKFGFLNDDSLYFRSFADDCLTIRDEYNSYMDPAEDKIAAALIFKEGRKYKIIPRGSITQIPRINGNDQYFRREAVGQYLVHSGFINGKHHDWRITCSENKKYAVEIPELDIHNYENDTNRGKSTINILKEAANNEFVPCFFYSWKDEEDKYHFVFGHTRFFRIPYDNSISNCIYSQLTDKTLTDLLNSLFGDLTHSSKLCFEDLKMLKGEEDEKSVPMILSSPKPTSFQLYLEQRANDIENLNHYDMFDSEGNPISLIRGNKLYWHKSNNFNWRATGNQHLLISQIIHQTDTQRTIIKPIKKDASFSGRIRFENLSAIELGALLFVLILNENGCHKIGMGKSLGLGSLKINPSLHLSNRLARYQSLSSEWGEIDANKDSSIISSLIKEFMDAVWSVVDSSNIGTDLWNHPRMKQLAIMLDWNNKPDDEKTTYMDLADFKHRMVLPTPDKVINP